MAEQQFKLTQENKALARRITILKQSTLELQNENQKLKRKLKDTQEHVNLEDLSEDKTDEMKRPKGRQFSTLYTKERLIKQFKDLKDQLAKEIKRTAYQFKEETKKELTIFNTFESQNYIYIFDKEIDSKELTTEKLELQYQYYRLIKTVITHFIPKSELNEYCYLEFRRKHQRIPTVEELLEGIYNNNKEYELAKTKEKQFKDTHEEEKKTKRYPWNKDILETRELIQVTDNIWETINDLINRINPINNSRLGAILLTLEGAKSIAREFYPHVLEYDKQRPNKIPAHILTRTQTLFPELTGRALVKEQEKQRNIYNNFLDNTQAQIEGIKKRLLAELPEFCKIFEDNPETGETEFYYGDYNNQFTILPFRFHHLILHHLEAIDNILYSEGARNKIYFEEEESYTSAYSEINKLNQEFVDQTKKMNIKEEVIIKELEEEYFKRTGRKIKEYGYCTIASEIKEIEPEYLEHEELYKKLDYLYSIVINNIGQHLIKRKETYDTVGKLNIYNCYSDNHTWNKLTIARSIFKLQEQVYQPYLGHKIGIVAANSLYADIIENIILTIYLHPFEEPPKHTEPHTLGPWNLYKIKDLLKHQNELVPILRKNIELIDGKIKAYEQDILDLPINAQKLEEIKIKMEKQPQRTQETFNFLNDIDLEIPEEEIPEIMDEQFLVLALNFGKLLSYEIQTLIKYKKKIQESIRPLRRIEHKIQTIEKSYKGFKYLSIFNKAERKIIAQKFRENPTIAELSQDNTILHKFRDTIFEFEIHKSSTNKLKYLKLRLSKDQTQINVIPGNTKSDHTVQYYSQY
ncbi:hypothetical protein C2G38_2215310 [Gigaspora rosea]|uniref:Uncharacterized protein n=1 Tax=Gigaspora rosea TaxID=44941 RepID=A0A397UAE5_9GLOM|nr:hypothetical protein C2G38_2215310 [Gigaspora rosea]